MISAPSCASGAAYPFERVHTCLSGDRLLSLLICCDPWRQHRFSMASALVLLVLIIALVDIRGCIFHHIHHRASMLRVMVMRVAISVVPGSAIWLLTAAASTRRTCCSRPPSCAPSSLMPTRGAAPAAARHRLCHGAHAWAPCYSGDADKDWVGLVRQRLDLCVCVFVCLCVLGGQARMEEQGTHRLPSRGRLNRYSL